MLRMEGISKRFATVAALDDVSISIERGEVHALVGENGAGKSTLVKIMTGAYHRDAGTMHLDGAVVDFDTPAEAQLAGVCAVHQEIHLLGNRSVAENIFLGREPVRWGVVRWPRLFADAKSLVASLGLDIDVRATLSTLSTARQQMVAIARGMSLGAKILVLDEPTSSLSAQEVEVLHGLIQQLRERGTSIVYISHRFDELYDVCDRVTILRDGKLVGTRSLASLERIELVCLMLGKSREDVRQGSTGFADRAEGRAHSVAPSNDHPLLSVGALQRAPRLNGVTLALQKGEIVGLGGLLGSGRTETARAIFGADPVASGTMMLDGMPFAPASPGDAIRAGIAFVSEDRKAEGIIPDLSVRENLTLAALPGLTRFGIVSRARQAELVERFMRRLGIRESSADRPIRELSGGNQQKVLLARWLCTEPRLLLLDEPTRGIDIGAKAEIQHLVNEMAAAGMGILMISSELEELIEGSARVVILRDGHNAAELSGEAVTAHAIISAMAGDA